ncbi:MAG: phosphohistidine phosphatase SixA [bacterium]|nr:phosphohistidine phosphatase SixA [bacterium]
MRPADKKNRRLYLVRHGAAVSETENPLRPLSEKGKSDTVRIAEHLREINVLPSEIWHSSKLRATQTADILKDALNVKKCFEKNGLLPNDDPVKLAAFLTDMPNNIMIVSHIPFVERFACVLSGKNKNLKPVSFDVSSVACFGRERRDRWKLEWLIAPAII